MEISNKTTNAILAAIAALMLWLCVRSITGTAPKTHGRAAEDMRTAPSDTVNQ